MTNARLPGSVVQAGTEQDIPLRRGKMQAQRPAPKKGSHVPPRRRDPFKIVLGEKAYHNEVIRGAFCMQALNEEGRQHRCRCSLRLEPLPDVRDSRLKGGQFRMQEQDAHASRHEPDDKQWDQHEKPQDATCADGRFFGCLCARTFHVQVPRSLAQTRRLPRPVV